MTNDFGLVVSAKMTNNNYPTVMHTKQILFASRPTGIPSLDNFQFVETEVPTPAEGQILVRSLFISVDPYLRGRMRERKSYVPPFELGQVIESGVVGEVIDSRSSQLKEGDVVVGMMGWSLYNTVNANTVMKIDPRVKPVSMALGVLGIPGLTAYFGLLDIAKPQPGQTVVVSGAAGAVGMTVCQIAKIHGCRVVGIAGGETKKRYILEQLGVDAAIDYKAHQGANSTELMRDALQKVCPAGVDVYFDNVGGEVSDAVMFLINYGARISVCGQISMYNSERLDVGLRPQPFLVVKSAMMQGFIITKYQSRFPEGIQHLSQWAAEGKLKHAETVTEGFENTPRAFIGLFSGENLGKQIVKVA